MTHPRAALLTALVAFLLHLPVMLNGFVWDDAEKFGKAQWDGPQDLVAALTPQYWEALSHEPPEAGYYRPVASLLFAWNQSQFGLDPRIYHAQSLLLHALVCALVVLLGGRLIHLDAWAALAAGLLFAVHPVHTEALAFASDLTDLLAATAYLGALLLAVGRTPGWKRALGVSCLWLLALGSKEMAITLPALLAFLIWLRPGTSLRQSWRLGALLVVSGGLYLGVRLWVCGGLAPAGAGLEWDGWLVRFSAVGRSIQALSRMLVWPWPLVADYGPAGKVLPTSLFASGLVVVAGALSVLAIGARKKMPALALGVGWLVLTAFPVLNLVPIPQPLAERFLYLPSVGLCLALAAGLRTLPRLAQARLLLALLPLLVAGAWVSWARLPEWRDDRALWSSVLRVLPDNPRALQNLAADHEQRGETAAALPLYARAYALAPEMDKVVMAYAGALYGAGELDQAIAVLRKRVSRGVVGAQIAGMLGAALARSGQFLEAAQAFDLVVKSQPDDTRARISRALCWVALGRRAEAEGELEALREGQAEDAALVPLEQALSRGAVPQQ